MRRPLALLLTLLLGACGDGEPLLPPDATLPDGSRYRGELVDGQLHGPGRLDHPDGSWYEGQFHRGRRQGQGIWQGPEGDRYQGGFDNGRFHGQGDLRHADGARYSGEFRHGRMHGQGTFEHAGLRYAGGFADDRYHGDGVLEQFGERYAGQFVAGELEGPGEYRNAQGERYVGEFRQSQFHGSGRYQTEAGESWSGQFVDGAFTGEGTHDDGAGNVYQGRFENWLYHGQGRLQRADGSVLEGAFRDGQLEGEGVEIRADGSRRQGIWRGGQRVADADGQPQPAPLELALLEQARLLQQSLDAVPPSTPAVELYSLILAGDGNQGVFLREADYVRSLLQERFAAHGQIALVNHRDHLADRPMATRESLRRAIATLAERSGPEDVILFYLTSHGSAEHELILDQPGLNLADLSASELAWLLRPLAARDKVVIVSACFSGGFIEPLQNERTLVITAARADRSSFGCSDEAELTYFGRALFAEALQRTGDLPEAFALAREAVAQREQADDYEPSEPQIWAPAGVIQRWRQLPHFEQTACSSLGGTPCR